MTTRKLSQLPKGRTAVARPEPTSQVTLLNSSLHVRLPHPAVLPDGKDRWLSRGSPTGPVRRPGGPSVDTCFLNDGPQAMSSSE